MQGKLSNPVPSLSLGDPEKLVDQVILVHQVDQVAFTPCWSSSTQPDTIYLGVKDRIPITHFALLAGTVEYADCISAEG